MKITCLIDQLRAGGAQRQLCNLAALLKQQGCDVSILTYHPHAFFADSLQKAGIACHCLSSGSLMRRVWEVRQALRGGDQDVVLAFLEAPALYAELAALPRRRWGLVVSERCANPRLGNGRAKWLRRLHHVADYVTTNSHTNRLLLEECFPRLRGRMVTVYNAVDLEMFRPSASPAIGSERCLRLLVVATYWSAKNPLRTVEAVEIARVQNPAIDIRLQWYGRVEDRPLYEQMLQSIRCRGLEQHVRLYPESAEVADLYRAADAVLLPSLFEGLPNVICEAMACGRPILLSNVSDASNLVREGYNGFLFDPLSATDMAAAITRLAGLSLEERQLMGSRSREMAEYMFSPKTIVERYVQILAAAANRSHMPLEHWLPQVPASAVCQRPGELSG
jgi:glycosyltransferase involved in cell wall biosynthesis